MTRDEKTEKQETVTMIKPRC